MLTFEDDFDGSALNESTWTVSNYSTIVSEYDGHDALFTAERVAVADSALVITTVWQPTTFEGVSYNMTSGWIDSKGKRNQVRALCPRRRRWNVRHSAPSDALADEGSLRGLYQDAPS